jgi:two-component system, sensor histidine kinase and response regulator
MLSTFPPSTERLAPSGPPQSCSEWLRFPQVLGPSVLVVDDDPDIPPLVDAAFSPFHIRIDWVPSGLEALDRLQQRMYDLVVLDLVMEDLHGFDVLRHLRAEPRFKNLKVLILTADVSHEALARSFGHGADDFVKKPFDLHELAIRAFRLIRPFDG